MWPPFADPQFVIALICIAAALAIIGWNPDGVPVKPRVASNQAFDSRRD